MPLRELAELVHSWTKLFSDLDAECKVSTARPPAVTPRNATPLVTSAHSVWVRRALGVVCVDSFPQAGVTGGVAADTTRPFPVRGPRAGVACSSSGLAGQPGSDASSACGRHGASPSSCPCSRHAEDRGAIPRSAAASRGSARPPGDKGPGPVCRARTPPAPPRCSSQGRAHSSGRTLGRELGVLSGEQGWPGRVRPLCSWALSSASSRQRAACSAQSQRRARRLACCVLVPPKPAWLAAPSCAMTI